MLKRVQMLQTDGTYTTIAQLNENQTISYIDYITSMQFDADIVEIQINAMTEEVETKYLKILESKFASFEYNKPALRIVPAWELNQLIDPVSIH